MSKIELRDLESLLRKFIDNDLIVVKYETESLLPPGEHFGSTMLKVHAIIRREKNNDEELNLVAKMVPASEAQREIFQSPFTFGKEIYLYQNLIPEYQRLEREFGIEESEVLDVVPKFYGARFSLSGGGKEEFDEDAVILLDNLKVRGYYMAERREGLDLKHAKTAITALSRFHALGIAMRQHKPDIFKCIKERSKCLEIKHENLDSLFDSVRNTLNNDPELAAYEDSMNAAMSQDKIDIWLKSPPETWSTIIHADFWINNFMFHKDCETGNIDVKFVDFQNYLNLSPLRELAFFLGADISIDVIDKHFDELLDYYYDNFISILERMKCDLTPYSRDSFDERMKIDAFEEFPHCSLMFKIMTSDDNPEQINDFNDFLGDGKLNSIATNRLRKCVRKFVEKGWLDYSECTAL